MTVFSTTPPRSLDEPGLADHFLRLIGDGDEFGAVDLVISLLEDGVPPPRILIDLIVRTQSRVGELWAADTWTIAREHAATAICERAVAAVAARTAVRPTRGRVAVACVDGEWHSLPLRILAEMLRLDGWRVDFLGANVPGPHLVAHLHQTGPDAVALSCMLATRLPRAHAAITACRAAGVPVIAGGPGFGSGGRYAHRLGADAWAADAAEAVERLAADWPPPPVPAPPALRRDLPVSFPGAISGGLAGKVLGAVPSDVAGGFPGAFAGKFPGDVLGDDEYTYVVRERPTLIATAMDRLTAPGAHEHDQRTTDTIGEDLGYVVDFLAAALYMHEPEIFTGFIDWTAAVLSARKMPLTTLRSDLTLIHDQLHDFPAALSTLEAGRSRLTS